MRLTTSRDTVSPVPAQFATYNSSRSTFCRHVSDVNFTETSTACLTRLCLSHARLGDDAAKKGDASRIAFPVGSCWCKARTIARLVPWRRSCGGPWVTDSDT